MFVVPFSQTVRARLLAVKEWPWVADSTACNTAIHTFTVSLGTPYAGRNIYAITAGYTPALNASTPSLTLNSVAMAKPGSTGTGGNKIVLAVLRNETDTTGVLVVDNSNSTAVAYRVLYVFEGPAQSQSPVQSFLPGTLTPSAIGAYGFGVQASDNYVGASGTLTATFSATISPGNPPLYRFVGSSALITITGATLYYRWRIDFIAEAQGPVYAIANEGDLIRFVFWD